MGETPETFVLNLRPRLAWRRASAHAAGRWYLTHYSWGKTAAWWVADPCCASHGNRCRDSAARRPMDTHLGNAGCRACPLEQLFSTRKCLVLHFPGNHQCCLGTGWTRRVVSRCLALWLEAYELP